MLKSKIQKIVIFAVIFLLQPLLFPDSAAHARRRSPPKAFSFIAEGGKAAQGECDGERKIPRRLKKIGQYSKTSSYMGSELQSPEIPGKADEEMWKHFFRVKATCNATLAKTPSAIADATKDIKPELPPEEDTEESPEEDEKPQDEPAAD